MKTIWSLQLLYHFKNSKTHSKKYAKTECVCFNEIVWLLIFKLKKREKEIDHMNTKYRDPELDRDTNILNIKRVSVQSTMVLVYQKKHLSNISVIMKS